MFGTKVEFKRGEYQDPCSGDGGGPLMTYNYEDKKQNGRNGRIKWYIIGKLGYRMYFNVTNLKMIPIQMKYQEAKNIRDVGWRWV